MEDIMNRSYEYLIDYGISIIAAILIFVIGKWIANLIAKFVEKLLLKIRIESTLAKFARNITNVVILSFVIVAALGKLGVETATLVTIIGAASLAIGLALQGSLSNFSAGVILIMFKPFKVGDRIIAGGTEGYVQEIHILNTVILTEDCQKEIVPNREVTATKITNLSDVEFRRIDLVFSISYEDDIDKAKEVLFKAASETPGVAKEKEVEVAVCELTKTSVDFVCRPWVKPEEYWKTYFAVVESCKKALTNNGITIPYLSDNFIAAEENILKPNR